MNIKLKDLPIIGLLSTAIGLLVEFFFNPSNEIIAFLLVMIISLGPISIFMYVILSPHIDQDEFIFTTKKEEDNGSETLR